MTLSLSATIKKTQITVGLKADGLIPIAVSNELGKVTVGPNSLLTLLEAQLGIPNNEISFTTRLIQYLACVDKADHKDAFYHASYQADPFSVARTLLQWRDHWYLAGWEGVFDAGVPNKLSDMAKIEKIALEEVPYGIGQRIQNVIGLLADSPVAISSVHLLDKLSDFPHIHQRLIKAIDVPITVAEETPPQAKKGSDLHLLQEKMVNKSNDKIELSDDGSLVILRSTSAHDSSPAISLFIQNWLDNNNDKSLAILAENRGDILDEALEQTNSPRLGFKSLSPWRPIFQVLPLAFELLWEPLNPTALLQFLSHPVGPIPRRLREPLAQVVADIPGINGEVWNKSIKNIIKNESEERRNKQLEIIKYWLEPQRYSPRVGIASDLLAERAQRVADWLTGAREATENPHLKSLFNIALNQADEFVLAVDRLKAHGRNILTRDNVLRLVEDVRGTGAPVTDKFAEISSGQSRALSADHAGAFYEPVNSVIWWDCQESDHIRRWPWSSIERAALDKNGVKLQSEDDLLDWLGQAWMRPILNAKEQCTIVLHDDAGRHHPIWDQISNSIVELPVRSLNNDETNSFLNLNQAPLESRELPPKIRWWHLAEEIEIPPRKSESYTSLDAYVNSPYQWLLRHVARIRPSSLAMISDGNQLKGTLAHRLYEEFLVENSNILAIDLDAIPQWVDDHVYTMLQKEGAVLLETGRQAECEQFVSVVQDSLKTLVEHLQQANVIQVEMELQQEGSFVGGDLNGSIDILATRKDGTEAIVDIKWGGRSYRRNALLDGSYLQLATYAQLRRNNKGKSSPSLSYFIVSDSHMLNLNHNYFPTAENIVSDEQEDWLPYWKEFEATWKWRKDQFDKGQIEVTVTDTEPTDESVPDEDCLAIPDKSDSFNDYEVITGWSSNK
jgi:ATP-dependent helicase/nuclease subunit B